MSRNHSLLFGGIGLASAMLLAACGSESEPMAEAPTEAAVDDTSEADSTPAANDPDIALETPVKQGSTDPIRGPGGLEAKCIARVSEMTGGKRTTSNRIEESEAAIDVYLNVEGVEEPWRCLGNKDGSISEVMYTGSEGDA